MKRIAAVALVLVFAVGCAGRGGTRTGSSLTRQVDDSAQRDHSSDFSQRPIGQR
jgi:hypothetical protein